MKLSIIVPVYNCAPWVGECLNSIAAAIGEVKKREGAPSVEVVCVDDGSTDGSAEIVEEVVNRSPARFPAFNLVRQRNLGVSVARNKAIEAATGDWLMCVDADDSIDPGWIVNLLKHVTEDIDWVHTDAQYCFQGIGHPSDGTYRTFLRDGWCVLNLFRRSLVGATRFREGMRFKEDVVFFTELALKNPRIKWVREKGYHYRRRDGSAIQQLISDADSVRFCREILRLGLPRADAGRTIGYDLVQWVNGRDWSRPYDPAACSVLAFWRRETRANRLRSEDVRWWWRPGIRHWLRTGDLSWLVMTRKWRVRLEVMCPFGQWSSRLWHRFFS